MPPAVASDAIVGQSTTRDDTDHAHGVAQTSAVGRRALRHSGAACGRELHPGRGPRRDRVTSSQPESANACLVEPEVVTDLVPDRGDDLLSKALGIVPEVADKCVAENHDLVW